ncbi:MAG: site-2 protease family protein [Chloroflexota bacterium]|nr:site-2 protease family protein [Chloroflexota bacterium]
MLLNPNLSLTDLAGIAIALVIGVTFHEFSHAFTADQLGDHRPRALGRVSLNPVRHIDPFGALLFLIAGFGYGRPVPVNVYALRPGRIGMAIVAAAGPVANVVVALVFAVVYRSIKISGVQMDLVEGVVLSAVFYNFVLAILNLIPIPPLDGYNVVLAFLPPRYAFTLQRYAQYGFLVLLLLVFLPGSPLGALLGLAVPLTRLVIGA